MNRPYVMEPITVPILEGCELLGIGRSSMYNLIAEKAVDVVKYGSRTTLTVESLKRCAASKIREAA